MVSKAVLMTVLMGSPRFNLDSYLASVSGSYWDFTKTDDQFQENTGPTPADDIGEAIGLKLDRAQWGGKTLAQVIAAASEINPNPGGPFSVTTGYSPTNCSLSIVGGRIRLQSTVSGVAARVAGIAVSGLVVGRVYCLQTASQPLGGAGALGTTPSITLRNSANNADVGFALANAGRYYIVATETSGFLRLRWDGNAGTDTTSYVDFDLASCKAIPGIPAIQSTGGFKSQLQAGGWARYDGSDDRHTQSRLMGSTGLVLIRSKFIAKSAGTRIMFGAVGSGGTDRLYCGNDSNGYAVARVGNGATITGNAVDRTDLDGTVGVVWDGTQAGLIEDGNVTYQSQTGAPTTTIAPTIGGYNNNGTPGTFSNFDAKEVIYLPVAPNAATIKKLHNALMAA